MRETKRRVRGWDESRWIEEKKEKKGEIFLVFFFLTFNFLLRVLGKVLFKNLFFDWNKL